MLRLLLIGSVFLSCAAKHEPLPGYYQRPGTHPRYRPAGYLTAVGQSGVSRQDAEAKAFAGLSQQLSAVVSSHFQSLFEQAGTAAGEEESKRIRSRVEVQSAFLHAELFKVVETVEREGWFSVFAVLDRRELALLLERDYEQKAAEFGRHSQAAKQRLDSGDLGRFGEGFEAVSDLYRQLEGVEAMKARVAGSPTAQHPELASQYNALAAAWQRWLASLRFHLALEGRCGAQESVTAAFGQAFQNLGLTLVPGGACPVEPLGQYLLTLNLDEQCRPGSFGPLCALTLVGTMQDCARKKALLSLDFSALNLKGAHTEQQRLALAEAYAKLTPAALEPLLRRQLEAFFPLR